MEQDLDNTVGVCCEPMSSAMATATDEWADWEEPEIPYEVDFGYPRSIEELKDALKKAHSQRNDPSKWITHEAFMGRLKQTFPWL
ncbi:MAG: hypothetical protein IJR87_07130 [Bacteroidaceae bacterium]|nr:hypothetical protein [Bacteroidaceae bacterium]